MSALPGLRLELPVMIYVPAYNCARFILGVLDEIPRELWDFSEVVVVDNRSTDGTADLVRQANADGRFPRRVHLVQTQKNLGYSGSQKTAYKIALDNPAVRWVVMLHGDGQYPPVLLREMVRATDEDVQVVYGHRDRSAYPDKDETPFVSYVVIRLLSAFESLATGYPRKEWHSGFVMYRRDFLEKVDLDVLTTSPHIDGHLLFASGVVGAPVRGLPIYKRYDGYEAFGGLARIRYVFTVLWLMLYFRWANHRLARRGPLIPAEYDVLDQPVADPAFAEAGRRAFDTFVIGSASRGARELVDMLTRLDLYTGDLTADLARLEELVRAARESAVPST